LKAIRKNHKEGRWEGCIKINLREIGWSFMDWIDPAQDKDQWRTVL
jgi:hypothetical protein